MKERLMMTLGAAIDNMKEIELTFDTCDGNGAIISLIPSDYVYNENELIIFSGSNMFTINVLNVQYDDVEELYRCIGNNSVVLIEFHIMTT